MAKLVAIGDSITQGFQSLAISRTEQSYPAIVADCLGLDRNEFQIPDFRGAGGLPFNIEYFASELEHMHEYSTDYFEWIGTLFSSLEVLDTIEDYWERGKGSHPCADISYHNLAIGGYKIADSYNLNAEKCRLLMEQSGNNSGNWLDFPDLPFFRMAYHILNPAKTGSREKDTQIDKVKRIANEDGQIGHLIIALGINNCLGTLNDLKIRMDDVYDKNLWSPEEFKEDYSKLIDQILQINNISETIVYLVNIPHITIAPVIRGIMGHKGTLPDDSVYFDYYTHFWIKDQDFDFTRHPHLTKQEVRDIDNYIDKYNQYIRETVTKIRREYRYKWELIDICRLFDELAVRRNHGNPSFNLPNAFAGLGTALFEIERDGSVKKDSGLFSLDGIHPTACGYSLIAQEVIQAMKMYEPDIKDIDFEEIRKWDTLVSKPPYVILDMPGMLQALEIYLNISRFMVGKINY